MSTAIVNDHIAEFLNSAKIQPAPKSRAQRFPIQTSLRYRQKGEAEWQDGITVNISRTGILFETDAHLEPKTFLEMQIVFPSHLTAGTAANIICSGRIVRTQAEQVGAAFRNYRYGRVSEV